MAKAPTFPTLYNEALQLSITKIKQYGYLEPGRSQTGTLNWNRNGNPAGTITIISNTNTETPFITLDYNFKGEPRNYKIYLTSIPSNLNRGVIWYFVCPKTNKRCRKLYSIGGYFFHREAFTESMYETQTYSKYGRHLDKKLGVCFISEKLNNELHKKHFKKMYAGKPTKKYLKIMKQMEKAETEFYNAYRKDYPLR